MLITISLSFALVVILNISKDDTQDVQQG